MNSTTAWINGVQVANAATLMNASADSVVMFGQYGGNGRNFSGYYYADVSIIDGQALEPTAFGRELTTGQWVPREVDFTPAGMRYSDFYCCHGGPLLG